jgi:hypothetical protein
MDSSIVQLGNCSYSALQVPYNTRRPAAHQVGQCCLPADWAGITSASPVSCLAVHKHLHTNLVTDKERLVLNDTVPLEFQCRVTYWTAVQIDRGPGVQVMKPDAHDTSAMHAGKTSIPSIVFIRHKR